MSLYQPHLNHYLHRSPHHPHTIRLFSQMHESSVQAVCPFVEGIVLMLEVDEVVIIVQVHLAMCTFMMIIDGHFHPFLIGFCCFECSEKPTGPNGHNQIIHPVVRIRESIFFFFNVLST